MNREVANRAWWWFGGALLVGVALAGIHKALNFDVDFDPWDDAYLD